MAKRRPTGAGRARVLIVDDHPVAREGLAVQLVDQPDLEVCGEAEDVAGALALVETARPDVAVIDLSLRVGNGLDLVKRLRARVPAVRVLVWSMHQEADYAERALRAGALGYVHKGRATREIVEAVRCVLAGRVFVSPELSGRLLGRLVGGAGKRAGCRGVEDLSDRELEAFELLGQGLATRQVAERMHVSPKTVDTYRARIKAKLGLRTAAEVVRRATQWAVGNG
jgi:DNA-binding NarL/FixJ family response regulator